MSQTQHSGVEYIARRADSGRFHVPYRRLTAAPLISRATGTALGFASICSRRSALHATRTASRACAWSRAAWSAASYNFRARATVLGRTPARRIEARMFPPMRPTAIKASPISTSASDRA
ncbi:hypothetical protein OG564_01230 [Streptomyces sp. NBC_01280]|uniref:hypothetical protein n=1 Tax=Streptomyces sp. NBC_01280 TaxID=2903810 RepID=UPI002E30F238|nr:hypothetical protein [Streptomyces sp. NBC_01280]